MLHLCFVDDSGDAEALRPTPPDSPPVFVRVGMTVPQSDVSSLTWDYPCLGKELIPSPAGVQLSELISYEMTGATLRKDLRRDRGGRNVRRRTSSSVLVRPGISRSWEPWGESRRTRDGPGWGEWPGTRGAQGWLLRSWLAG